MHINVLTCLFIARLRFDEHTRLRLACEAFLGSGDWMIPHTRSLDTCNSKSECKRFNIDTTRHEFDSGHSPEHRSQAPSTQLRNRTAR